MWMLREDRFRRRHNSRQRYFRIVHTFGRLSKSMVTNRTAVLPAMAGRAPIYYREGERVMCVLQESVAGANLVIVESTCRPRVIGEPSADRLLSGPSFIGVVDGSTLKPWESPQRAGGGEIASVVAQTLESLPASTSAREAVNCLTAAVHSLWADTTEPVNQRPCATFAVLAVARRELWRVGDAWLLVDGQSVAPERSIEQAVALERADLLRERLGGGARLDDLLRGDPGRATILPRLSELSLLRNAADSYTFGAVDGSTIPDAYVEVIALPANAHEVVIASDGYPRVAATLAETEAALRDRVTRDPLMIEEPPTTKGVMPGADSFDDRSFIRVRLPEVGQA